MKSKKIMLIGCALILAISITGVSLALLTTVSNTKANEFVPGVLDSTIVEEFTQDPSKTTNQKVVQVKNTNNPHEVDAYIRVMLVPTFRTAEGTIAGNMSLNPSSNDIIITAPKGGTVTLTLDSNWASNWVYHDGYYYHKSIVSPGDKTAVILASVKVSDVNLWDTFQLEVLSDAIQAEGGKAEDVWGAIIADQLEQP